MGNGYDCTAFDKRADGFLYLHFIFRVKRGGRFVQQNDLCVFQHSTCDGYTLLFPTRKCTTTFAYHRVVSLRQAHYEIVATGFLGGSDDFFIHCIGFTEADIVAYRILKQTDILKNHRDVAHQAFRCYFIHRNTVEKEVSLLWIVETGTKLHHRAFPTVPSSSVRHELT